MDQIFNMAHHADDVAETILFRLFGERLMDLDLLRNALGEGAILRLWLTIQSQILMNICLINNILIWMALTEIPDQYYVEILLRWLN